MANIAHPLRDREVARQEIFSSRSEVEDLAPLSEEERRRLYHRESTRSTQCSMEVNIIDNPLYTAAYNLVEELCPTNWYMFGFRTRGSKVEVWANVPGLGDVSLTNQFFERVPYEVIYGEAYREHMDNINGYRSAGDMDSLGENRWHVFSYANPYHQFDIQVGVVLSLNKRGEASVVHVGPEGTFTIKTDKGEERNYNVESLTEALCGNDAYSPQVLAVHYTPCNVRLIATYGGQMATHTVEEYHEYCEQPDWDFIDEQKAESCGRGQ